MIYFDISDIDLSAFGLYTKSINVNTDITGVDFTITFNVPGQPSNIEIEKIEDFLKSLRILNSIHQSTNPGVKDQYERLLTILALSS